MPEYPSSGGTATVTAAVTAEASRAEAAEALAAQKAANLADLANAAAARASLGLGSAATQSTAAFDAANSAAAAQSAAQSFATTAVAGEATAARAAEALRLLVAGDIGGTPAAPVVTNSHVTTASATNTYTALASDSVILADATTNGPFTVNLPTAVGIGGKTYTIKKTDGSVNSTTGGVNAVTVDASGSQTIDGALTYVLNYKYATVTVISNGTNWITAHKINPASSPDWISVLAFGADPTGATDSTNAIQACINYITGSLAPATNTRIPIAGMYVPKGTYKVSSDLVIQSVQNFRMEGAGPYQTTIIASGTAFIQSVLLIDGSADGVFQGFQIEGNGTEQVTDGIRLDGIPPSRVDTNCVANGTTVVTDAAAQAYDVGAAVSGTGVPGGTTVVSVSGTSLTLSNSVTAGTISLTVVSLYGAVRSTSGNVFRDIRIRALNFITGLSLEGNGGRQLDGTTLENVIISGKQAAGSWSNTGNWLNGFAYGNGTFGNNYDHRAFGCDAAGCYYGTKINASSLGLYGSQPANNFSDFWIVPAAQCTISNVQSQSCGQFITAGAGSFSPIGVSVEDVVIKSNYLNSSAVICSVNGGLWHFKNFAATNLQQPAAPGTYVLGTFTVTPPASARPGIVTFDNLVMAGARTSCILSMNTNPMQVVVRNYVNYTVNTGLYTTPAPGDLLSTYFGGSSGSWINLDQAILPSTSATLTSLAAAGLTGATNGARFAGGTASGAPGTGAFLAGDFVIDASGNVWVCTASGSPGTWAAGGSAIAPQVNFYTASSTWTKPTGAKTVFAAVLGPGGGGGAGASGSSATAQCGGGGGAGAILSSRQFVASDLASSVTVTVGTGGAGGAAATSGASGSVSGGAGSAGSSASSFGTYLSSQPAGGGSGGTTTTGTGAASPAGVTSTGLGSGATASTAGGAGVGTSPAMLGAASGPAGGGVNSGAATAGAGAAGNHSLLALDAVGGSAGVVGGASPTSGTASAVSNGSPGPAPGSGAASITGAAQAGASALANSGAGGAGGGAATSTFASGAGGSGGSGWVLAVTYFQ